MTFSDFEDLLYKDSQKELSNEKWMRSLEEGVITVKDKIYTLKTTSNKRKVIYDLNNKIINI